MVYEVRKVSHPLYRTKSIQHDYFSKENILKHPERMVLVGFVASDGCISHHKSKNKIYHSLCFNICLKDKEVLDIFNNEICKGERHLSFNKMTNSLMMSIPSPQICYDLGRYNIVPRKTSTYRLPDLSGKEMAYFLRGYFYGDGCVSNKGAARVYNIIGTKEFCEATSQYLLNNKIVDACPVYRHDYHDATNNYRFFVMKGRQGAKFSRYLFFDDKMILLKRKTIITEEKTFNSPWLKNELKELWEMRDDLPAFCKKRSRSLSTTMGKIQKLKWAGQWDACYLEEQDVSIQ